MRPRSQPPRGRPRAGGGLPGQNFLLCLLLALLAPNSPNPANAAIVDYELNVTHGFRALDGVERLVILGAYTSVWLACCDTTYSINRSFM